MKFGKAFYYTLLFVTIIVNNACKENEPEPITVDIADFSATIDENPAEGVVLGTAVATATSGTVSYSITSQTPAGAMVINAATGELTVANASLFDFETNPILKATVSASAEGVTESATVTISLNDVIETVTVEAFALSIDENPLNGQILGTVVASTDAGAVLTYSIIAGGNAAAFAIDESSGELSVADSSFFDFETNPTLKATFEVSNGVSIEQNSLTITLNDVTDLVIASVFAVTIDENPVNGQVLGTVSVISDATERLNYSMITGTNSSAFSIDASTGELKVVDASVFDFETNPTVTAFYRVENGSLADEAEIRITLNDLEEFDPDAFVLRATVNSFRRSVQIPTNEDLSGYVFRIDWGDGTISFVSGNRPSTHNYPTINSGSKSYTIQITGAFPAFRLGGGYTEIVQWGNFKWATMERAFEATNGIILPEASPDLSLTTSFERTFRLANNLSPYIANWDVQNITNMKNTFRQSDVSTDISGWNTENVTTMESMFISSSLNQNISNWDLSSITTNGLLNMLNNSGLSVTNYDTILNGWADSANTPDDLVLSANGLKYSAAGEIGRDKLTNDKNWTITGDSKQ